MTMQEFARPARVDRYGVVTGAGYTFAEVETALKAPRYEIFRHELHRIVDGQWRIVANLDKAVITCTIKYDRFGKTFMRSAAFEMYDDEVTINWRTDAVRTFWLLRMPDGSYAQWMMGTFYLSSPVVPLVRPLVRKFECYDALVFLHQSTLTDWLTIPSTPLTGGYDAGDPVGWARAFIADRYPLAGVDIPSTAFRIPTSAAKLYEPGTTLLDLINDLLLYCNYEVLRANVTGSFVSLPFVQPSQRPVDYEYVSNSTSIIVRGVSELEEDTFNAFNQWVRTVSRPDRPAMRSRYTLTDPGNPLSTTYRHQTVTNYEAVDVADQATLDALVKRVAEEGQRINRKVRISTPLMPHDHSDTLRLNYTGHSWSSKVDGKYIERGWTFPCTPGGPMRHEWELAPYTVVTNLDTI